MDCGFHDLRQTKEWADYLRQIGWEIEKIPNNHLTNYLYIKKLPLIPFYIGKLQRVKNIDWERIKTIRKKYRIIFLQTKESVCKRTIWLDLRKSQQQLLGEMKSKMRYNIGLAKRREVKVEIIIGKAILQTGFYELLRSNARRLRIFALPKRWFEAQVRSFKNKCFAVLAFENKELVGGNFFMCSPTTCFYAHNGSTELGRKLMAPSLCVWEGILEAKRRKLKIFDFEGIYDGSWALRRWRGFTRFKRGFGGNEREFISFWRRRDRYDYIHNNCKGMDSRGWEKK